MTIIVEPLTCTKLIKLLLALFTLISFHTVGTGPVAESNCSIRIISKTNPITGKVTFAGKEKFKFKDGTGESSIDLLIVRQNKELTLRFKSDDGICVSKSLEISLITQTDKTVLLKSNSKENCKGSMIFNFGGMFGKDNLKEIFKSNGIQAIMFEDTDHNLLRYDLQETDKRELKQVLECLLNT